MIDKKEVKKERFVRIAERRVNKILGDLDSLGKCSDKKNYQYSDQDVKKIFTAIDQKVKEIRVLFQSLYSKQASFKL